MSLILNEVRREWWLSRQSPLHYAIGCIFLAGLFYAFQAGYRYMGGGHDSAVNSYLIWLIAANGLTFAATEIEKDIQRRMLQHVYLADISLQTLTLIRSAIGIIHSVAVVFLVALLIGIISGGVHVDMRMSGIVSIIDSVLIGIALGWISTGLALLFRPIPLVLLPIQLLLMVSVAIRTWHSGLADWLLVFLPLTPASVVLSSGQLTPAWAAIMGLQALIYVSLGIKALQLCERLARRRGSLMA